MSRPSQPPPLPDLERNCRTPVLLHALTMVLTLIWGI